MGESVTSAVSAQAPGSLTPTPAAHHTALLVVDVQQDYLSVDGLVPSATALVARIRLVLEQFRTIGSPIAHVRTEVEHGVADSMPHRAQTPLCVRGTRGAQVPELLTEQPGEAVITKQFFSAFTNPDLDAWLRDREVKNLVIVGLYTHACVRETAVDAYSRGFDVTIVSDGIGSNDPVHASSSLDWIGSRAARLMAGNELPALLYDQVSGGHPDPDGRQINPTTNSLEATDFDSMLAAVRTAQQTWQQVALDDRVAALREWARVLRLYSDELTDTIVREVHKPVRLARDEVDRAVSHVESVLLPAVYAPLRGESINSQVTVVRSPLGVVALLMPWNNPLALPVSNIAPALLAGNAVVLKPAPEAVRTAALLRQTLDVAGIGPHLVSVYWGGAEAGVRLARASGIDAVAVTGSSSTGRSLAVECARTLKPLRAELGGNNAAIVLPDADLDAVVPALALNAFAFAGQRCTALRRFVVDESILEAFIERMRTAMLALHPANPHDADSALGPLISDIAAERVLRTIGQARVAGVEVLVGGTSVGVSVGGGSERVGVTPTLMLTRDPRQQIVQQETFGPVAVIQPARDLEHALELANGVAQGLVLAICTADSAAATKISRRANAGIVQKVATPVPVHPLAPFGGWKASGFGGAEHGRWDIDFYSRVQAVYS